MNRESKELKQFVTEFDFPNPDWTDLPTGFPFCDTSCLNKEERGLYSAIISAWIILKADTLKEKVFQYRFPQKYILNNLYLAGKVLFILLFLILITGNLLNFILIQLYQTIL